MCKKHIIILGRRSRGVCACDFDIWSLARSSTNSVDDAVRGRGNDNIHISVSGCSILISFVMRSHINLFIVLSLAFAYRFPRGGCVCVQKQTITRRKQLQLKWNLMVNARSINKNRNINLCVFESMGGIVVHVSILEVNMCSAHEIVTRTEIDWWWWL